MYERLKVDENERLEKASEKLRAKNGKLKEEKMARRIVVLDSKTTTRALSGTKRKRSSGFVGSGPQKKNSLLEKARKSASISQANYSRASEFNTTGPTGRKNGTLVVGSPKKVRREPAPPNDNTLFGRVRNSVRR